MKFLIIQRVKPETPIEVLSKLTPAQLKYVEGLKSKRKVETYYHLVGQQGHMLIANADSEDDLSAIVGEDPLFFHCQREIYPLTTLEAHKKHLRQLLKGQ